MSRSPEELDREVQNSLIEKSENGLDREVSNGLYRELLKIVYIVKSKDTPCRKLQKMLYAMKSSNCYVAKSSIWSMSRSLQNALCREVINILHIDKSSSRIMSRSLHIANSNCSMSTCL